jgi:hypothetical protein
VLLRVYAVYRVNRDQDGRPRRYASAPRCFVAREVTENPVSRALRIQRPNATLDSLPSSRYFFQNRRVKLFKCFILCRGPQRYGACRNRLVLERSSLIKTQRSRASNRGQLQVGRPNRCPGGDPGRERIVASSLSHFAIKESTGKILWSNIGVRYSPGFREQTLRLFAIAGT